MEQALSLRFRGDDKVIGDAVSDITSLLPGLADLAQNGGLKLYLDAMAIFTRNEHQRERRLAEARSSGVGGE